MIHVRAAAVGAVSGPGLLGKNVVAWERILDDVKNDTLGPQVGLGDQIDRAFFPDMADASDHAKQGGAGSFRGLFGHQSFLGEVGHGFRVIQSLSFSFFSDDRALPRAGAYEGLSQMRSNVNEGAWHGSRPFGS